MSKTVTLTFNPASEPPDDDRADWIRENLTTRHKWGINDFPEFYDRDVTYLLNQNAELQSENERLKTEMAKDSENCFHAKRILEGQMSLMVKELEQLRSELANITKPSRQPEYEHTTHHYACACREAEFARWKDRAERAEAEVADWRNSMTNALSPCRDDDQTHCSCVPLLQKRVVELEALLSSGLLLERHSPDEVPQCPADIVGRTIIAELKNGMIVETMWLKSKPDVVSRNGVDIPFSELKCWYANEYKAEEESE